MTSKGTELGIPYTTSGEVYSASIVLPLLSLVLVGLRWRKRTSQNGHMGMDDWLLLPALAFTIGMGITLIIGVHGRAIAYPTPYEGDLSLEEQMTSVNSVISLMGKVQYAFLLQMILAFGFIKLSIVFFYRRLFVIQNSSVFSWITIAVIAICIAWTVSFFFAVMFICGTEFHANWGSVLDQTTYCTHSLDIDNALVVSDTITDVIVLVLPMPVIWRLQMTMGRKMAVVGILVTGSISIVASIIKIVISFEISNGGLSTDVDPDLTVSTVLYYCMLEGGLALLAINLPVLQAYVNRATLSQAINSFRDVFSLESMRSSTKKYPSKQSDNSNDRTSFHRMKYSDKQNLNMTDSFEQLAKADSAVYNAHMLERMAPRTDIKGRDPDLSTPTIPRQASPGITVSTDLQQRVETV